MASLIMSDIIFVKKKTNFEHSKKRVATGWRGKFPVVKVFAAPNGLFGKQKGLTNLTCKIRATNFRIFH